MFANRYMRAGAYGIALLLIVMPFAETLASVWPLRLGEVNWRFGTMGFFSKAFVTPMIGALVVAAVATATEGRIALRLLAIGTLLYALVALVFSVSFVLDALQLRANVRPEARRAFELASALAFLRTVAAMVIAVLLSTGAWHLARGMRRPDARSDPSSQLVHPRIDHRAESIPS